MASITLQGNPFNTNGDLPAVGSQAPAFELVRQDLSTAGLDDFPGRRVISIFPSIDTPVCAISTKTFNEKVSAMEGVSVLNISADLPFAFKRFCAAEGLEGVESLSTHRSSFASDYGIEVVDGPLQGLCARAVLVLNANGQVIHSQLVTEVADEPDYDAALSALDQTASA